MANDQHSDEISRQLDQVTNDLSDIKSSMGKIAEALTRLALLEERHSVNVSTTRRIEEEVQLHDRRLDVIEKEQIRVEASTETAIKAVKVAWAVLGAGVLYVGGKVVTMVTGGSL
jgi:chromosome segregation ATPase